MARPLVLGTAAELSQRIGGTVRGDGNLPIASIAAIDEATPDALTFATSRAYLDAALASRAAAVLVDEALLGELPAGELPKTVIAVGSARAALATLLRSFERPRKRAYRHPSAVIAEDAVIGDDVYVGAGAIIESAARVGDRSVIEAGSYVGARVTIGADAMLYPHVAVMDDCVLGNGVSLHPGAVIGSDGFGYVFVDGRFEKIPQIGNVVLGNDVEIGANTCVDRAQTGSTRIGDGTKIDNLCQIGHNVRVGAHTGMAALSGLAGSAILGDYVQVGAQAGVKGHLTVGSRAKIAARSAVWKDVPDDAFVSGQPARPHGEEMRREVMIRKLPKLIARVDALEGHKR